MTCADCGRVYKHSGSLILHRKVHQGLTTCCICGSVTNRVADLRAHLCNVHKFTKAEAKTMVPSTRMNWNRAPQHSPALDPSAQSDVQYREQLD